MENESRNLQNDFFNAMRKQRAVVNVFLGNGKKLTGRIRSFDKFTVLLESSQGDQIVFKHAISTVSTAPRSAETAGAGAAESGAARVESAGRRRD